MGWGAEVGVEAEVGGGRVDRLTGVGDGVGKILPTPVQSL